MKEISDEKVQNKYMIDIIELGVQAQEETNNQEDAQLLFCKKLLDAFNEIGANSLNDYLEKAECNVNSDKLTAKIQFVFEYNKD